MKETLKAIGRWIKDNRYLDFIIIGIMITAMLLMYTCSLEKRTERELGEIEYIDSVNTYHKLYYEGKIRDLKAENSDLYDSIKQFKDKIDYLVQFKYSKDYSTGIVHTKPKKQEVKTDTTSSNLNGDTVKVFEYSGGDRDTMQYKLKVASREEPEWYSLNMHVSERFTIINKEFENGLNETTIQGDGQGNVSNVIVVKPKEKYPFWKRFMFGPAVTAGYDPINKNLSVVVGVGATFDLGKRK